jgi:putative ABC transport system substrate-binding protein
MRRREFITLVGGATLARPLAARAQQKLIPSVGFLSGRSLSSDAHLVAAFRQGLSEIGYVEGQNLTIEFRWAEGQFDRLPGMVADLIGHQVSVIFAGGMDVQIRAVKDAISTTPAVYAVGGDPVEYGIVASMNRPGGNATAVTVLTAALWPKRLEILRELLPSVALIGILINPNNLTAETIANDVGTASHLLGVEIKVVNARSDAELNDAFAVLKQERVGALLVMGDTLMNAWRYQLISLANRYSIPSIYDRRDFPVDGGLMSYGASPVDQYLQSGRYVGRILSGAKPADLPALQPTRFDLVINLKTAKALGLTVPQSLLVAADEVIE